MSAKERLPNKVKLAGDLQTAITGRRHVRHGIIPKGTICDVIDRHLGQLTREQVYKLRLYDEIFFASEIDIEPL